MGMSQAERTDHIKIVEALEAANITVYVNEEEVCGNGERFLGAYIPGMKAVVICQEHAKVLDEPQETLPYFRVGDPQPRPVVHGGHKSQLYKPLCSPHTRAACTTLRELG